MKVEEQTCPYCGASMKMYWHSLTPSLLKVLVKIYVAVSEKGDNRIHPHKEMKLTASEHMNMTKLRFHGLIAKCKKEGKVERGYWLITRRGGQFLKGEIAIPRDVQTFRNKVTDHKGDMVRVKDIVRSKPVIQNIGDFEFDIKEIEIDKVELKREKVEQPNERPYKMEIGEDNIARRIYLDE